MKVKLSDVIGALDEQSDDVHQYLDRKTGRIQFFMDEELRAAEDADFETPSDDSEGLQEEVSPEVADFLSRQDDFIALPDQFEINEWDMMRDFIGTIKDSKAADRLDRAIHGRGAFRYFKDSIHELGMERQWFDYRNARLREIAIDGCEAERIGYVED